MGTSKIALFNNALGALGHRRLADTGEPIEAGRELNAVYSQVVEECLASASWNFAMETVQLDADTGVTPSFGYPKVFAKPTDWLRTIGISQDEYFSYPLMHYYDDSNFFSADNTPIYLRYVSDDTGLGLNLTRWPAKFTRFVELELAERVCTRITQNVSFKREDIQKDRDKARKEAKTIDAMDEGTKFKPASGWTMSRWGSNSGRDRGGRGSLIG